MTLLIKNAQLVSGQIVNIFIKEDLIYDISQKTPIADQIIEADGNLAMPGIIDPHVHFRVPGAGYKEDWETGSKAAAAGGITTVLDMPNNQPPTISQKDLERKGQLIRDRSYVNYGLYIGATETNLEELKSAQNIVGIKVYLGSTTGNLLVRDYNIVEKILRECDQLVAFHSEDEECILQNAKCPSNNAAGRQMSNVKDIPELHSQMRPEECAIESTQKIINIVKKTKKQAYICHVSSQKELELIHQAKKSGQTIYAEATPHHLFLNTETASKLNNFAKVNPPLRSEKTQRAMQSALNLIDIIGTDHAPHTEEEKSRFYHQAPSGMPGLETSLPLMLNFYYQGKIGLDKIVELMCRNPAKIFNIKKRGDIEPGFFADLTIVDLHLTKQVENSKLYTKCKWSPFAGRRLRGWPIITLVNGQVVFQKNKIIGSPMGREVL
ncbi:MAG: dihydroorotase [Patescibacteria group bacterium]